MTAPATFYEAIKYDEKNDEKMLDKQKNT